MWNTIKAALIGEFKALNTYIRKEAVFQTAKLLLEKISFKKKDEKMHFTNSRNDRSLLQIIILKHLTT